LKLAAQDAAERHHAASPFEPDESEGVCAARVRKLTAQEAKGALLFVTESCAGCHGPNGKGGPGLYRLPDLTQKAPEELGALLEKPNAQMLEGGMEEISLTDGDLDALVAYLRTGPTQGEQR
jgi:mono/diheme cytochrome c family protein